MTSSRAARPAKRRGLAASAARRAEVDRADDVREAARRVSPKFVVAGASRGKGIEVAAAIRDQTGDFNLARIRRGKALAA